MSAETFDYALTLVLACEGGFVDHPRDPGGATNRGITRAVLARARGRPVSVAEVKALSQAEAGGIYRRSYWDTVRGDDLPAGLDLAVFDCAVNSGPGRAVRLLQHALGLTEDGACGAKTLAAARAADPTGVIKIFTRLRLGFLGRLATWSVFGRGWRRRIDGIERAAVALAAPGHGDPRLLSSPQAQEKPVEHTKSMLASRTVWANAVGLACLALSAFGFNTAGLDTGPFTEAIMQVVTGASLVASTVFRVVASKRLAS